MTLDEVKRKMANQCRRLYPLATRWLRFVGRLQERPAPPTPCAKKIKAFADYMEHEEELSPATISNHCWCVRRFSINCVSKAVLCTRSLLIGSTWRFRNCSNQEAIRG